MRRRKYLSVATGAGLISMAGCIGAENNDSVDEGNPEEDSNTAETEPTEYITEIGFEPESSIAQMYGIVSDDVSQINLINSDGSSYRSVSVNEGETKVHLGTVGTFWNKDLEFVVLDSDGNTLETFTRTFEPTLVFENLEFISVTENSGDEESEEPRRRITAEIKNTGNSPLFIHDFVYMTGYTGAFNTHMFSNPNPNPDEMSSLFSSRQEEFVGLFPGESTIMESREKVDEFRYIVDTLGGREVIRETAISRGNPEGEDIVWDESEFCQGEYHDLQVILLDSNGDEYSEEMPLRYSGGTTVVSQGDVFTSYRCNSIEQD